MLRRRISRYLLVLMACTGCVRGAHAISSPVDAQAFRTELLLGEIQFHAAQGEHYEALAIIGSNTLLSQNELRDLLKQRKQDAGTGLVTLADIELAYRMNQRAGQAVQAVLDADTTLAARNQAAYDLARMYYDKQQYDYAGFALQLIRGDLYNPLEDDVAYLRAMIDARTGDPANAVDALRAFDGDPLSRSFVRFNLAHLQLQQGDTAGGVANLRAIGTMETGDTTLLALKDKANLVLGYWYLDRGANGDAISYLDRVRLDGVFTNKALLGQAWAYMNAGYIEKSLVPWTHLSRRRPVDSAVLESVVALPYLFGKLGLPGKSIRSYESAVEVLDEYESKLRSSLAVLEQGELLLVEDGSRAHGGDTRDIVTAIELIGEFYASKAYRESAANYRDLEALLGTIDERIESLVFTQAMVKSRVRDFDEDDAGLDAGIQEIASRLDAAGYSRRQLDTAIANLAGDTPGSGPALDALRQQQDEIGRLLQQAAARYEIIAGRRETLSSFAEFEVPLAATRERLRALRARIQAARDEQKGLLRAMTAASLEARLALLQHYAATAKYELAKTYDEVTAARKQKLLDDRRGTVSTEQ